MGLGVPLSLSRSSRSIQTDLLSFVSSSKLPWQPQDPDPSGGLLPEKTPQIIMDTLDDDFQEQYFNLCNELFDEVGNRNGSPAAGTLFTCHNYTNYFMVEAPNSAQRVPDIRQHGQLLGTYYLLGTRQLPCVVEQNRCIKREFGSVSFSLACWKSWNSTSFKPWPNGPASSRKWTQVELMWRLQSGGQTDSQVSSQYKQVAKKPFKAVCSLFHWLPIV